MKDIDDQINNLFMKAKAQTPVASYQETAARFSASIAEYQLKSSLDSSPVINSSQIGIISIAVFIIATFVVFNFADTSLDNSNKSSLPLLNYDSTKINSDQEIRSSTNDLELELSSLNSVDNKKNDPVSISTLLKNSKETPINVEEYIPVNKTQENQYRKLEISKSIKTKFDTLNAQDNRNYLKNKTDYPLLLLPEKIIKDNINFRDMHASDSHQVKETEVLFTITELSLEKDFYRIKKLAEDAGITFKFQVHHQRKERRKDLFLIRDFVVDMSIPSTDHVSQVKVEVPKWGKFEVIFGWVANDQGRAISLTENITINSATSFYSK